jgi:glutathione S-transferase/GST-like protein
MLQLYTWDPNSNSGKPIFALKEKGVEFEYHYIDLLKFEQHAPEYLEVNPAGTVPTLIHDGKRLTESSPMCEYIDAAFSGPSLRPKSARELYLMRRWCRDVDTKYAPALSVLGWHAFMGPMVRRMDPKEIERLIARIPLKERRIAWSTAVKSTFTEAQLQGARDRVAQWIKAMDDRLAESPYLAGPTFSVADIVCFANAYALPVSQPELAKEEKAPHYFDWLRRIYARPATRAAFELGRTPLAARALQMIEEFKKTKVVGRR